ncbi:hypothetical protein EMCRGX_G011943 [Ephydatia muelleri]
MESNETTPLRGPMHDFVSLQANPSDEVTRNDILITADSASTEMEGFANARPDVTGAAIKACKKWLLHPYSGALIMLGWLNYYEDKKSWCAKLQQSFVIMAYLCIIMTTFILQFLVCFQREILYLNKEVCVSNESIDVDRVCCHNHIVTAFIVPDFLILTSYLFGIYLFSHAETEYLSKLAEVFTKTAHATEGKYPKKLIATIGAYFLAGIAWIICSLALRLLYLVAFKYWDSDMVVYWNANLNIAGSTKHTLIALSIVGFIFMDLVYVASIINYAIQSELNVYLLKAISRSVNNKIYSDVDESCKEVDTAEYNLQVLNGKTATGASLVIFNLSISTIVAFQQLEQFSNSNGLHPLPHQMLGLIVASLNALLWIAMIVIAFVQASRVTGAGLELKRSAVSRRSRRFQYTASQQSDLDSFVLYTQAVKLRAKLFGVPVVPWVMHAAVTVLCFVLIIVMRMDIYNPFPNV